MKNLVKIGLTRLYKKKFYIVGCVLAFAITLWFLKAGPIPQLVKYSADTVALLLSAAITLYFSLFTGLFMGNETEDGILRNKVMAGHSQVTVYLSHYVTLLIAMVGMFVCWLLGAIAGGTVITSKVLLNICIVLLANAGYIAVVLAICFRIKKQVVGIIIGICIFYILVTTVLVNNYVYMISCGTPAEKLMTVVYNISAVGQCFAVSDFVDEGLRVPLLQLLVSVTVALLATLAGTCKLAKRNIK